MGIAYHTEYAVDGLSNFAAADRTFKGIIFVTYTSTSGTATGTAVVSWTEPMPTPYAVVACPVEKMTPWVVANTQTSLGFTLSYAGFASLTGGVMPVLIFA